MSQPFGPSLATLGQFTYLLGHSAVAILRHMVSVTTFPNLMLSRCQQQQQQQQRRRQKLVHIMY